MNLAFTLIVKKVFEERVFTEVISPSVDSAIKRCGFDIKGRYSLVELERLFKQIHQRVMSLLFKPEPMVLDNIQEEEEDDSDFEEGGQP